MVNRGQCEPLGKVVVGTTKAQNVAFFGTSLTTAFDDVKDTWLVLLLAFDTNAILQFTIDDGVTWLNFNGGQPVFPQNYSFPRPVGAKFNLRCTDVAGCVVRICNISESGGP